MTSDHGKMTGEFGAWLTTFIQSNDFAEQFIVYFDHGDKEKFPNVVAIKGFYGEQVSNRNRLADIDVVVVNEKDEVELLIEIEEMAVSPKKLLGDIFSILCCNRIAVKVGSEQKQLQLSPKTQLIVAGIVPAHGSQQEKIHQVILPRLRHFAIPNDAIPIANVSFVGDESPLDLLERLKRAIKVLLAL